jgi:exonuclease SbcD
VVIGGNHDSPNRLDAPAEILRTVRVHVVGGLPRRADSETEAGADLDTGRAVIPLHGPSGDIEAWLVAVPYLRPSDLPSVLQAELAAATGDAEVDAQARVDRLTEASSQLLTSVRAIYDQLFAVARAQRQPGQALVAAGHCFLAQTTTSVDSERKIQLGNKLPLPADLFPTEAAYVALGHLHLGQSVGGQEHIRYSGSPIPMALSEADYPHQVLIVDLQGEKLAEVRAERVPRSVDILRVPAEPRPLAEVLPLLQSLPAHGPAGATPDERPYLEVRVQLGPFESNAALRKTIEDATASAWPRLLRIAVTRTSARPDEPAENASERLRDLDPEEVLRRCYQRSKGESGAAVPERQLQLFQALLEMQPESSPGAPLDRRLIDAGGPP